MPKNTGDNTQKPTGKRKVNRSAESGEFVSEEEAKADPKGTITQTVDSRESVKSNELGVGSGEEAEKDATETTAPSTEGTAPGTETPGAPADETNEPESDTNAPESETIEGDDVTTAPVESEFVATVENAPIDTDPLFEKGVAEAEEDWAAGQDQRDAEAATAEYEAEQLAIAREAEKGA